MEEKVYGISKMDMNRFKDEYVLKQGETIDVERLRDGLEVLIRKNNEALMEDIKELLNKK